MWEEHARALKYFAWFSAGLFALGIIIESLKQPQGQSLAVYSLLGLIGLLCHALMYAEWKTDQSAVRSRPRR